MTALRTLCLLLSLDSSLLSGNSDQIKETPLLTLLGDGLQHALCLTVCTDVPWAPLYATTDAISEVLSEDLS